jgi:hypothetical protein
LFKRRSSWVLPGILLAVYIFLKLQAWSYARQAAQLEKDLNHLRPTLSAIVLSGQLERALQACQAVSDQVRRLDLQNGRLLEQISKLPASITLDRLGTQARLKVPLQGVFSIEVGRPEPHLQTGLRIQGTLAAGIRDPESVLVRWAQSLQSDGMNIRIPRLIPSPRDPALWSFELYLEGA